MPSDGEIQGQRQNLESNALRVTQRQTRPAPLTDFLWPEMQPLPLIAGHTRQEQIASA